MAIIKVDYGSISGGGSYTSIVSAIPNMTSNTSPTGYVASAQSIYSSNYEPYKAFNNDEKGWAPNTTSSNWIKIELPTPTLIIAVSLKALSGTGAASPKVYGSKDDVNYDELGAVSASNVTTILNNVGNYKYYKFEASSGWSTSGSGYKLYLYMLE